MQGEALQAPQAPVKTTLRNQRVEQITAIIKRARPLVEAIGRKDDGLESQLRRSLTSIPLNIAEGFGVHGGNARLRFRSALGSLYESQAALRVAAALGYVREADAERSFKELEAFGGRLYGLIRR